MPARAGVPAGLAAGVVAGLLGAIVGVALGESYRIAASAFLAGTVGAIAFEDIRQLRVPDPWNLAAALGGFVFVWLEARAVGAAPLTALGRAALAMLLCGGAFFLLREIFYRSRGVEGLGLGDVKLAATGGIWLGWEVFPLAVMVAALGAILFVGVVLLARKAWPRERKIPFAAFLAPAIWLCWCYAAWMGAL
jgi:leader peptidase (prepilin peptidase)/N-methyltransferase